MTFARLLLEIRRRAARMPNDLPQSMALAQAAQEVLKTTPEQEPARQILAGLLGIGTDQDFDTSILGALSPETVLRLDMLAERMVESGRTDEAVRAIRAALIRLA